MKLARFSYPIIALTLFACHSSKTTEKPEARPDTLHQPQKTLIDTTTDLTGGLLKEESLGDFKIGMPFRGILKGWTATPKVLWGSDGFVHQSFMNTATTDEVNICSDDSAMANAVVFSVMTGPLSSYKTAKNMGIGSTYPEVFNAYKNYINSQETNDSLIVTGSIYGGLIFNFEKGKVTHIFMGAAAE